MLVEGAAILALTGEFRLGVAIAVAGGVALILAIPPAPAASWMRWSGASRRAAITVSLAIILTFVALGPFGGAFGESGGTETASGRARPSSGSQGDGGPPTTELTQTYPGVIMWTEEERHTVLVPPLPAMSRTLFNPADTQPLSIPFFGSYWFFRRPQREPPATSIVVRGNPAEKGFRSTDRVPMVMQARQNLGRTIDITCCRAIDIALSNADRWPGTVGIELVLLNSGQPQRPSFSLGRQEIKSSPLGRILNPVRPAVFEVLSFPIPPSPPLRSFDEFVVLFHLGPIRADKSAKIAIERFVLTRR
jgi:hypothetical protein